MKKVAIYGLNNDSSLASIVGFMPEVLFSVVAPPNSPLANKARLLNIETVDEIDINTLKTYDLLLEFDIISPRISDVETLKLHPALLPAFNTNEPLKDAYLSGVKVSGVTVYSVSRDKIIAQFPVLVENDFHFEEYVENIQKTENLLYPIVIKSVLENRAFSFSDMMGGASTSCSGNCGSCSGGCK